MTMVLPVRKSPNREKVQFLTTKYQTTERKELVSRKAQKAQ